MVAHSQSLFIGDRMFSKYMYLLERLGNLFVHELARLFQAYAYSSAMELVALYVVMVMPSLLLQRFYPKSKSKDHIRHLERRLS